MKYSVVIPAYNCEGTLQQAVESILQCGLNDFEIMLVDDGSKDNTPELCDKLTRQYPCVRCIHQENAGTSAARNRGMQEVSGEYIWFFDSDDFVAPKSMRDVEIIVEEKKPEMLMFGMSFDYYHKGTCYRSDEIICEGSGLFNKAQWETMIVDLFHCNYLSPVWNKFVHRSLITEHRINFANDMHLMEDCLFTLQCLEHCETVYLLPKALYHYRQSEDEGNAGRRLKKIPSLVDYMENYSVLPQKWNKIIELIYFMLLHQKVRASNLKDISKIAEDHKRSYFHPQTRQDQWLSEQLRHGKYLGLYLHNLKSHIRHKAAVVAKSHGLYH